MSVDKFKKVDPSRPLIQFIIEYCRGKVKTKIIAFKNPTCILYKGEEHLKDESTGSFATLL